MIKGVNRQFVEVNNTESPFFDKVIFILSANATEKSDKAIEKEVHRIITEYDLSNPLHYSKKQNNILSTFLKLFIPAIFGASVSLMISHFF